MENKEFDRRIWPFIVEFAQNWEVDYYLGQNPFFAKTHVPMTDEQRLKYKHDRMVLATERLAQKRELRKRLRSKSKKRRR